MTKNNYSEIKSFKDFKEQRVRLQYQIRLTEKKMEIKKMELQEFLNPIRLVKSLISQVSRPLFGMIKSKVQEFIYSKKKKSKKKKKSSGPLLDVSEH